MVRACRKAAIGAALVILAAFVACSSKTTQAGGLEVIITTRGLQAGTDFDTVEVVVQQETSPGHWHQVLDLPRRVPSEVVLPSTVSIQAGRSSDQEALIEVTALRMNVPQVQRGAQVQIPTERVAELVIVLSRNCVGKVTTCANGSCEPDTGLCAPSIVVDPGALPTYMPGDQNRVDAGEALDGPTSPNAQDGMVKDASPEAPSGADADASVPGDGSGGGGDASGCAVGGGSCDGSPWTVDAPADAPAYYDPGIQCGAGYCPAGVEVCCYDILGTGGKTCLTIAQQRAAGCPGSYSSVIACDDTIDCEAAGHPGTVCCSDGLLNASCMTVAACKTVLNSSVLCDLAAPVPCPSGATCGVPDGSLMLQCIGL